MKMPGRTLLSDFQTQRGSFLRYSLGDLFLSLVDIPYYIELQRRTFDIFRYVSCHEKNFDTYAVILESLLVETCSFFDSLSQTFIREKSAAGLIFKQESGVGDFKKKVSGKNEFNFGDYRTLLEGDFALSKLKVNLNPYEDALYSNPMHFAPDKIAGYLLVPFDEWATGKSPLPWWRAFTDVKHDRLKNFREAKLKNVIYALAAVFIVLTLRNEAQFKAGSINPELYELFFPKYWAFKGRIMPGTFMWS
jgi:hypothetical protein